MNSHIGDSFNPIQFGSDLVNADKATEGLKKPEEGKQNKILQILNNTRLGRSLVKKQGWETFSANDLAVKAKMEGLTQELKEVNRQIKETKRAIKPEIIALHKELQKAKIDLAKTTRALEKTTNPQKKANLNEKKQEIEQKIEGLKEKKKLLRQNEIQNLTNLRQEWGQISSRLTDLRKELEGTRLHNSSVVKSLHAAEQKIQNEFEDFASKFPGHHAFKASSLEQKIASNLKRIELYEELGVNPNKSEILKETQKYIVKLHVLSYKVHMSGETETAAQINQILTKLEAAFPDFALIKDEAIAKGFAIREERLKEGQNPPLFQNATKAEVDPSTFHSVDVQEAGGTAVAKFCDKADTDFLFKIAGGIYNEDSGAVGQFEDGTGYVVVGDGEGSTKGNSVYWTHVLCEEVGRSLQKAHQALSFDPTDKTYTQGVLQEALGKGYEAAAKRMESAPDNLNPRFNPERDASAAISFSISCKIPGTEEKMIFGMNCSDASIAVWEPKRGFTQLETSNEGGFVKFTPEIKTWDAQNRNFRTNLFQFRVPNEAKMVGFSDGVTDCFYVDEKDKSPSQVKQETMQLMNQVVRNPMFDEEPKEELPATESKAKELVAQGAIEGSNPAPGEIVARLLNYSKWKTQENAEKNSKMMAIQEGYANQTLSREGAVKINFTIGRQISSALYEILSDKAKKSFTLDETGNYVCTEKTETEKLTAMKRETWNNNYAGTHQELGPPASFTDLAEDDRAEAGKVIDRMANPTSIDDYVLVSESKINEKFVFLRKKDSEGRSLELGRKLDDVVAAVAP